MVIPQHSRRTMNDSMTIFSKLWLPAVIALLACSCETTQQTQSSNRQAPSPINSIRVASFKCNNEITGQAVRNVFMEVLLNYGDVKVIQEGDADVVIEGTVTTSTGTSSSAAIGGGQSIILGKSQNVGGDYVTGVTCLALRSGEIFTSASWGQNLEK